MKLSKENIQEIIKLYTSGSKPTEIAGRFNIYPNSVNRIIKKNGVQRQYAKKIEEHHKIKSIDLYLSGISSEKISDILNISSDAVRDILKSNNIPIRPPQENKRRNQIKSDFFETIDNEEKAYFLGLMYADGNLSSRSAQISITLKESDSHILENFSNIIYGFIKLKTYHTEVSKIIDKETGTIIDTIFGNKKNDTIKINNYFYDIKKEVRTYTTLSFYGQKIYNDLCNLGCHPNKSFTINFPTSNIIPDHLMQHFIRGFYDGDGGISLISSADGSRARVYFTSTDAMLVGIKNYLFDKLNIQFGPLTSKKKHIRQNKNTRSIEMKATEDVKKFCSFLYKDANVYLHRKFDKYKNFLNLNETKSVSKFVNEKKYGTSYIEPFNGKILTKYEVLKLSNDEIEDVANHLFNFYRNNGFPYPYLTDDEILQEFSKLKSVGLNDCVIEEIVDNKSYKSIRANNQNGLQIFKNFAPHFFEIKSLENRKPNLIDAFNDDKLLMIAIKNRLKEGVNMTGSNILSGFIHSRVAFRASLFHPTVARTIYGMYTKDNDIIYDYSAGFGQRLLGALSLDYNLTYIGVDPEKRTVASNEAIKQFFIEKMPGISKSKNINIKCCGSEEFCPEEYIGKVNFAFSSPPYFNLEKYSDDTRQAYNSGYSFFINNYWKLTGQNIFKLLKNDGILALNINNKVGAFNIKDDMSNILIDIGFKLVDKHLMLIKGNGSYAKPGPKYELILIFKK